MTAYERRRRAGRRRHEKRMAKKARPKGRVILKRILIFLIILILAAGATAFAYVSSKWNKVEKKKIDAMLGRLADYKLSLRNRIGDL